MNRQQMVDALSKIINGVQQAATDGEAVNGAYEAVEVIADAYALHKDQKAIDCMTKTLQEQICGLTDDKAKKMAETIWENLVTQES